MLEAVHSAATLGGVHCPTCGHGDSQVTDSRPTTAAVRRRRRCIMCGERFTTFESVALQGQIVGHASVVALDHLLPGWSGLDRRDREAVRRIVASMSGRDMDSVSA